MRLLRPSDDGNLASETVNSACSYPIGVKECYELTEMIAASPDSISSDRRCYNHHEGSNDGPKSHLREA